jgi:hypothetical protein
VISVISLLFHSLCGFAILAEISCALGEVFQKVRAGACSDSVSEIPKSCCDSC